MLRRFAALGVFLSVLFGLGVAQAKPALMSPQEAHAAVLAGQAIIVDVREPSEFAESRIAGAVNVPLSQFDPAKVPMPDGKTIIFQCRSGARSAQALNRFSAAHPGKAANMSGGILAWVAAGLPVETR